MGKDEHEIKMTQVIAERSRVLPTEDQRLSLAGHRVISGEDADGVHRYSADRCWSDPRVCTGTASGLL